MIKRIDIVFDSMKKLKTDYIKITEYNNFFTVESYNGNLIYPKE